MCPIRTSCFRLVVGATKKVRSWPQIPLYRDYQPVIMPNHGVFCRKEATAETFEEWSSGNPVRGNMVGYPTVCVTRWLDISLFGRPTGTESIQR